MPKRFTDTEIWKNQRWFRKLSPINKLIFFYIKDQCNHAGIWKIDCSDLIDDLGLDIFSLENFISEMNSDFDKISGNKTYKERVKIIKNNNLWITGFIQFQYESKEKIVSESSCVRTALQILKGLDIYEESISKGYITLKQKNITPNNGLVTDKDKDSISFNTLTINKYSNELIDSNSWESEKKYFKNDEVYFYKICSEYKFSKDEINLKIEEFLKSLELGEDFKSVKELKRHFSNWIKKQKKETSEKPFNPNTATGTEKAAEYERRKKEYAEQNKSNVSDFNPYNFEDN
jgi:hypothetical protein